MRSLHKRYETSKRTEREMSPSHTSTQSACARLLLSDYRLAPRHDKNRRCIHKANKLIEFKNKRHHLIAYNIIVLNCVIIITRTFFNN